LMTNLTEERQKIIVSEEAARLLEKLTDFLQERHIDCYLVGGFVRDGLMGRTNHDIDLIVAGDALDISSQAASHLNGRMVPLDEENQVARVVFPRERSQFHLDFASLRGSIEQDLRARDFTVNCIALNLTRSRGKWSEAELIDPLNGLRDLRQRIIRAVSEESFKQDPVRLLRAIRFCATHDFHVEPKTESLIRRDSDLITTVAGERLRDELCFMLNSSKGYDSLRRLDMLGLLTHLMPELTSTRGVVQPKEHYWDVFEHSLETVACVELVLRERVTDGFDRILALAPWSDNLADYFSQEISGGRTRRCLLKLAALLHDIAKPATKTIEESGKMRFLGHAREGVSMATLIMERLRFSNREIRMVQLMIEHHMRPGYLLSEDVPSRRAIYRYFRDTEDVGIDTLFLGLADHLAARGPTLDFNEWQRHTEVTGYVLSKWFEEQSTVVPPKLIDGHILMEKFGLAPGPRIGEILEMVREAQAAGEIHTAEEALEFVARRLLQE
jgi:poly(A) polymerase